MKIEVDTQNASKEELRHLAQLLMKLSGQEASIVEKPKNIFADDSPAEGGLFNIFGNNDSERTAPEPMMGMFESPSAPESKDVVDDFKIEPY